MINLPDNYIELHPAVRDLLASECKLYIDGQFVTARSGKTFTSIDPSTEQVIAHVSEAGAEDIGLAVASAHYA